MSSLTSSVRGLKRVKFEMMTDGTEERQFLYAEDCCEALETVMESLTLTSNQKDPLAHYFFPCRHRSKK